MTVSSEVARMGRIRFDDLQSSHRYSKWTAYAQSKLANQLFTRELDTRATRQGLNVVSVAAHPGYAATNLQAVGPQMSGSGLMKTLTDFGNSVFAQSAAAGALPSLFAATDPSVRGGSAPAPTVSWACVGIRRRSHSSARPRFPPPPSACGACPRSSPASASPRSIRRPDHRHPEKAGPAGVGRRPCALE